MSATATTAQPKRDALSRKNGKLIWIFLAPTLIGLGLFNFLPIIGSTSTAAR